MIVTDALIRSLIDKTELELMRSMQPPSDPDEKERWLEYRGKLHRLMQGLLEEMRKRACDANDDRRR
jgi:hypothetical protein